MRAVRSHVICTKHQNIFQWNNKKRIEKKKKSRKTDTIQIYFVMTDDICFLNQVGWIYFPCSHISPSRWLNKWLKNKFALKNAFFRLFLLRACLLPFSFGVALSGVVLSTPALPSKWEKHKGGSFSVVTAEWASNLFASCLSAGQNLKSRLLVTFQAFPLSPENTDVHESLVKWRLKEI